MLIKRINNKQHFALVGCHETLMAHIILLLTFNTSQAVGVSVFAFNRTSNYAMKNQTLMWQKLQYSYHTPGYQMSHA